MVSPFNNSGGSNGVNGSGNGKTVNGNGHHVNGDKNGVHVDGAASEDDAPPGMRWVEVTENLGVLGIKTTRTLEPIPTSIFLEATERPQALKVTDAPIVAEASAGADEPTQEHTNGAANNGNFAIFSTIPSTPLPPAEEVPSSMEETPAAEAPLDNTATPNDLDAEEAKAFAELQAALSNPEEIATGNAASTTEDLAAILSSFVATLDPVEEPLDSSLGTTINPVLEPNTSVTAPTGTANVEEILGRGSPTIPLAIANLIFICGAKVSKKKKSAVGINMGNPTEEEYKIEVTGKTDLSHFFACLDLREINRKLILNTRGASERIIPKDPTNPDSVERIENRSTGLTADNDGADIEISGVVKVITKGAGQTLISEPPADPLGKGSGKKVFKRVIGLEDVVGPMNQFFADYIAKPIAATPMTITIHPKAKNVINDLLEFCSRPFYKNDLATGNIPESLKPLMSVIAYTLQKNAQGKI